jgi:general stress protein YciG
MTEERAKARCGFAAMDPEKQRLLARKGGASVPHHRRSFSVNRELAVSAGRKGGQVTHHTFGEG